jgi:hypothetical protein
VNVVQAWLRSAEEQAAMRPVKPEAAAKKKEEAKAAAAPKPPLPPAPELTPQGTATAGLSSLRSALLKSMGPKPAPASSPAEVQEPRKPTVAKH